MVIWTMFMAILDTIAVGSIVSLKLSVEFKAIVSYDRVSPAYINELPQMLSR